MTEPLPRRGMLALLGAGAAGVLGGCTGGSHPPMSTGASGPTSPRSSGAATATTPGAADWTALAAGLQGVLVQSDSAGFAQAHQLYDPRWDAVAPAAVVRAGGAADVAEAVRFAGRHGLRLVARGGGHSYLGASSVAGGLVVDTRALSSVAYDAASATATIGAGAQLIDVYTRLSDHGRALPAGTCPTVGVAGLAQGGGFGVFDRARGLTCDSIVEMDVVRADGSTTTIDSQRDPDLFWALRGGGGGDFAIVTQLRARTFGTADVGRWSATWSWSHAAAVLAGWQRFMASAPDDVWANLHLDVLPGGRRSVVVIGIALGGRSPSADRDALVRQVAVPPSSTGSGVHSHLDTVLSLAGCSGLGTSACHLPPQGRFPRESFVAGSSVPSRWLTAAGIDRLVSATSDSSAWTGERHAICDPLGGAVSRVSGAATAFPWRAAPFTVQWYAKLPVSHPRGDVVAAGRWLAGARSRTAVDAPGAYVNYPSSDVPSAATYHGAAYSRLRSVKRAVDPQGFFRPPAGVAL